jgi:hypothetical protein
MTEKEKLSPFSITHNIFMWRLRAMTEKEKLSPFAITQNNVDIHWCLAVDENIVYQ